MGANIRISYCLFNCPRCGQPPQANSAEKGYYFACENCGLIGGESAD